MAFDRRTFHAQHASFHPISEVSWGPQHDSVANVLVAVVAALHIYFLVLEMFLWTRPLGLKTFRNSIEKATEFGGVGGQPRIV